MHEVWSQEPHSYRVLLDEKCLSCKTEVYLLLSMISDNCLWSDRRSLGFFSLRRYANTERKLNVSLADQYDVALSLRITLACLAF